jgi:hypothetical protein
MQSLTHNLPELLGKIAAFLLIANYLLLKCFPGNRAIFVLNANNLMNRPVDFLLVARSYLNTGLSQNVFQMAKIARHRMSTSRIDS